MKGIILSGGSGTRLYPLTSAVSKQLLPIYDKPMIFYPLSTLMIAGIKEILIISTPQDIDRFKLLLDDGSQYGIKLSYKVQNNPDGLAQAFILGEEFIGDDLCALILGDNIFYGNCFDVLLKNAIKSAENGYATVFGYKVRDPQRFGIVDFDSNGKVKSIEEKPEHPLSNYAVTGLYFYDSRVTEFAKNIKPSDRGELEITDINKIYLNKGNLNVAILPEEFVWMDTGTFDSMFEAIEFIKKESEKNPVCVPEIIAYNNGWISIEQLKLQIDKFKKSPYSNYLKKYVGE